MALTTFQSQAIVRDITQTFADQAAAATPLYPMFCNTIQSQGRDEKYGWLGAFPGMREWFGDRDFKQTRAANYTLENRTFESSLQLNRFDVDDDRTMGMQQTIGQLAIEATHHPDELFDELTNTADASNCFDGQFFYDTDHVWGDSGTQSNDLTYTVTSTSAVTSAEFRASFHAALIQMLGFSNDQGKKLVRPRVGKLGNLVCRVPLALYEPAVKAFEQILITDGESNFMLEKPMVIVQQGLTSSVKWQLDYLGGNIKPFVFQARSPLRFQAKLDDDIEFKFIKAMTEARYAMGYLAWWTSVQTTFST